MTVSVFKSSKFHDERGSLYTIYDNSHYVNNFILDKISTSKRGVIRGFHGDDYTWKLITCLFGTFKLVVYDIDKRIKEDFLLSSKDDQSTSILVPPRHLNAHQCLSEECVLHYKWDHPYDLYKQYSVKYDDEVINCKWMDIPPILSDRDLNSLGFKECFL